MAQDLTAKPAWWDEKQHGKWDRNNAQTAAAFREVLGRDFSVAELEGFKGLSSGHKAGGDAQFRKWLSLTPEARLRGVDPAKYGNKVVDPASLSAKDQEWYAAYRTGNPGSQLFDGELDILRGQQDRFSLETYRGIQDGTIETVQDGIYKVTQAAIDKYGDKLKFRAPGTLVIAPKGSKLNLTAHNGALDYSEWKPEQQDWAKGLEAGGYELRTVNQDTGGGIGGFVDRSLDKAGLPNWARNVVAPAVGFVVAGPVGAAVMSTPFLAENLHLGDKAYFLSDPLNLYTGLVHGSEGAGRNLAGGADLFDSSAERVAARQGAAKAVVKVAANFLPGGSLVSAGLSVVDAFNTVAGTAGDQDWGRAFVDAGAAAIGGAVGMSGANALTRAGIMAGTAAGATALTGGSGRDIGVSAATSLAGSFVGAAAQSAGRALDLTSSDWQAALQGSATFGVSYGGALWSGQERDSALFGAALTAGQAVAGAKQQGDLPKQGDRSAFGLFKDSVMARRTPSPLFLAAGDRLTPWETKRETVSRRLQAYADLVEMNRTPPVQLVSGGMFTPAGYQDRIR